MVVLLTGMCGVELGQLSEDGTPKRKREKEKEEVRTNAC